MVTAKQSDRLPPGPEGQDSGKTGQGLEGTHTGTQVLDKGGMKARMERKKPTIPGIALGPKNLLEHFQFSICSMSPHNKSCDVLKVA